MASKSEKQEAKTPRGTQRRGHHGLGRTETRIAGKFRSEYTNARLYEVVHKAALHVKPLYPKELRQTEFDGARFEIGHADAPSARQIATRLRRSWPDIVSDAVDERADQTKRDAIENREEHADWVTGDHIHYALRKVAKHVGVESLTRDQFGIGRAELIAEDRKRHHFGGVLDENLPTLNQIETAARKLVVRTDISDWEKALIVAKMSRPTARKPGGIEQHVAIHYYIQASGGILPTSEKELSRFREIAGFGMKRRPKNKTFEQLRADGVAYAASLGQPTTGEIPKPGTKPDFDLAKIDAADLPRAIARLTKDEKLVKLAEYLDLCEEQGVEPRDKHYRALATKMGWPAASRLGENMLWGEWIAAADAWRRSQVKKKAA